jgi:hypothetical protein
VSSDSEKLLKALGLDEIAMQILTLEERELLVRFNKKVDMLKEEREIPADCNDPDEIIAEAFRLVPGAKRALYKYTNIHDNLMKAGSG